jgi:hypothetical protein
LELALAEAPEDKLMVRFFIEFNMGILAEMLQACSPPTSRTCSNRSAPEAPLKGGPWSEAPEVFRFGAN